MYQFDTQLSAIHYSSLRCRGAQRNGQSVCYTLPRIRLLT